MGKHKFVNIVDKDLKRVLEFCKWNEENFEINVLTGINFTKTNDKKYLLGLVFVDENAWQKSMDKSKEFNFEKVIEEEQDWLSYYGMTDMLMLGNFSYKMLEGKDET